MMRIVQVVVVKEGSIEPVQMTCPDCGFTTFTTEEQLSVGKGYKTCEGCWAKLRVIRPVGEDE